jgi:dTDP-4-dehydrorhamnose 3,5-epimerase
MIASFVREALPVAGCFTFRAIRAPDSPPDVVEFFNVTKSFTNPAMQQVNVTRSHANVIRGVHISGFAKVVFCPVGRIFDVVVDMRPDSPTFKQACGAWLDRDTHIVCPEFCAHGVFAAEEDSVICYYQMGTFFGHLEYAVSGRDPALAIPWPAPVGGDFVRSEKDLGAPPADAALWATIKARIDDPLADIHTATNSDVVVVSAAFERAAPFVQQLQRPRTHVLQASARDRESLYAALFSLRPMEGVVYVVNPDPARTPAELTVELLNAVLVCAEQRHPLVVVAEEEYSELAAVRRLVDVTVVVGQGNVADFFNKVNV